MKRSSNVLPTIYDKIKILELKISGNNGHNFYLNSILLQISKLKYLEKLFLSYSVYGISSYYFTDKEFRQLIKSLRKIAIECKEIKILILDFRGFIRQKSIQEYIDCLSDFKNLKILFQFFSRYDEIKEKVNLNSMGVFKNILTLCLFDCHLELNDNFAENINSFLPQLKRLTIIETILNDNLLNSLSKLKNAYN